MYETHLECWDCGQTYETMRYRCDCGGGLEVVLDLEAIAESIDWPTLKQRTFDHHRYREFYPIVETDHIISLSSGGTTLIPSTTVGPELGLDNLYFKFEGLNPTGSFKDRGTSVEVGKALDEGASDAVVASTGNMGASVAAYCARAGITAHIFVPADISGNKFTQMQRHGAEIHRVDGDYTAAAQKAREAAETSDWFLMGDYAYRAEGEKSVGYEIMDETDPDTIVTPVGNGTLLHGIHKGIEEMQTVGLVDTVPRMVGGQAKGCSTVADAFQHDLQTIPTVDEPDTIAGAIACGDPLDGKPALDAIRKTGGFADAVPDSALEDAVDEMAREGIYAEESCGAALATIMANREAFDSDETIVCVVTGHGLKTT